MKRNTFIFSTTLLLSLPAVAMEIPGGKGIKINKSTKRNKAKNALTFQEKIDPVVVTIDNNEQETSTNHIIDFVAEWPKDDIEKQEVTNKEQSDSEQTNIARVSSFENLLVAFKNAELEKTNASEHLKLKEAARLVAFNEYETATTRSGAADVHFGKQRETLHEKINAKKKKRIELKASLALLEAQLPEAEKNNTNAIGSAKLQGLRLEIDGYKTEIAQIEAETTAGLKVAGREGEPLTPSKEHQAKAIATSPIPEQISNSSSWWFFGSSK